MKNENVTRRESLKKIGATAMGVATLGALTDTAAAASYNWPITNSSVDINSNAGDTEQDLRSAVSQSIEHYIEPFDDGYIHRFTVAGHAKTDMDYGYSYGRPNWIDKGHIENHYVSIEDNIPSGNGAVAAPIANKPKWLGGLPKPVSNPEKTINPLLVVLYFFEQAISNAIPGIAQAADAYQAANEVVNVDEGGSYPGDGVKTYRWKYDKNYDASYREGGFPYLATHHLRFYAKTDLAQPAEVDITNGIEGEVYCQPDTTTHTSLSVDTPNKKMSEMSETEKRTWGFQTARTLDGETKTLLNNAPVTVQQG